MKILIIYSIRTIPANFYDITTLFYTNSNLNQILIRLNEFLSVEFTSLNTNSCRINEKLLPIKKITRTLTILLFLNLSRINEAILWHNLQLLENSLKFEYQEISHPFRTDGRRLYFTGQDGVILTKRQRISREQQPRRQTDVYFILTNQGTYLRFIILGRLRG